MRPLLYLDSGAEAASTSEIDRRAQEATWSVAEMYSPLWSAPAAELIGAAILTDMAHVIWCASGAADE